jgi:hypothetical protein
MLDTKQRETQLLKARERLARAFARQETIIRGFAERIRLLESSRDKSEHRVREIEELLERERAITEQRQSLSESAMEEIQVLKTKLEKAERMLAERDTKISDLENYTEERNAELLAYERSHTESLEREQKIEEKNIRLESENIATLRQLELLREERENLQKQLADAGEKENLYALTFTQDERLGLLKTIDTLIERVDEIAGVHN